MAIFSVALLTAVPPGLSGEAGGAFVRIDGRESVLRAVEMFLNRDNVRQIQLIVPHATADDAKKKFGANLAFSGVKLALGGPRWMEQLQAAAKALADEITHVIVHDAARPAVPYTDLESAMAVSEKADAVMLASPVRGPLVEVDEGLAARAHHPASGFMLVQTPQIFSRRKFMEVAQSGKEPHASEWTLVKGSPLNVRVNGGQDASFVKAMLGMLPKPKLRPASSPFEEAQW